jgi:hypothetical protein
VRALKVSRIALATFILLYVGAFAVSAGMSAFGAGESAVVVGAYVIAIYSIPGVALAAAACIVTQLIATFRRKNKQIVNG